MPTPLPLKPFFYSYAVKQVVFTVKKPYGAAVFPPNAKMPRRASHGGKYRHTTHQKPPNVTASLSVFISIS